MLFLAYYLYPIAAPRRPIGFSRPANRIPLVYPWYKFFVLSKDAAKLLINRIFCCYKCSNNSFPAIIQYRPNGMFTHFVFISERRIQ